MATFKAEVFSVQFIIHYCPVKNERIAYSYSLLSYLGIRACKVGPVFRYATEMLPNGWGMEPDASDR